MKGRKFVMKQGGVTEVLDGNGKEVGNIDDLYCSDTGADLIFVPKVVGVHQVPDLSDRKLEERERLMSHHSRFQDSSRDYAMRSFGRQDDVSPDLISVVYDPEAMPLGMLRKMVGERDGLGRVKLASYREVPDFEQKVENDEAIMRLVKMTIGAEDLEDLRREGISKSTLETQEAILRQDLEQYGLTRDEVALYRSLSKILHFPTETAVLQSAGLAKLLGGLGIID